MTGKGLITYGPRRRLKLLISTQLVWLALVCMLAGWWGSLLFKQAARIVELEGQLGLARSVSESQWLRTQRMLIGESSTFLVLLLIITSFLFWLYWRDTQRTRGLEAFFASVTHELRTPLTSIRLQAESIADSLPAHSEQQALISRLLEDSSRLESQVQRTLELARVEGGGPVFVQAMPLRAWIDRAMQSWKQTYGDQVSIGSDVDPAPVMADPSALDVILKNLIENSIRHGLQGQKSVTLRSQRKNGFLVLSFEDNGPAFRGEFSRLGRLFEKGPLSSGAGVGLYLVRVLMERMGGRADFRPAAGATPRLVIDLWFKETRADG